MQKNNYSEEMITEESVRELANNTGLSYSDAERMLREILDEEYAD